MRKFGVAIMLFAPGWILGQPVTFEQRQYPDFPNWDAAVFWSPSSVHAADLNQDGVGDLVVANRGFFRILLGSRSRGFAASHTVSFGEDINSDFAVVDINGDGKLDIAAVRGTAVLFAAGNGDGTFQPVVRSEFPPLPETMEAPYLWSIFGDFDGDGKADLASFEGSEVNFPCFCVLGSAVVRFGEGNGEWGQPVLVDPYATLDFSTRGEHYLAALRLDDRRDALILSGQVYSGAGRRFSFLLEGDYAQPSGLAPGDFDGDGARDIVWCRGQELRVYGKRLETFELVPGVHPACAADSLYTSDFNGDKKLDVIAIKRVGRPEDAWATSATVFLGDGNGGFLEETRPSFGGSITYETAGDLDGDGFIDVAVVRNRDNHLQVFYGRGGGNFDVPLTSGKNATPSGIVIGDFTGDGNLDIAVLCFVGSFANLFAGRADGGFEDPVRTEGQISAHFASGDFNGDGKRDLMFDAGNLWLGREGGRFDRVSAQLPGPLLLFTSADINGDGTADLVGVDYSQKALVLVLGTGNGTWARPVVLHPGRTVPCPTGLALADFNHDGITDISVSGFRGGCDAAPAVCEYEKCPVFTTIWFGQGGGAFNEPTSAEGGGALALDLNRDNFTDFVRVADGNLEVFYGRGDGTFLPPSYYPARSPYLSELAAADFDGDGTTDLLVQRPWWLSDLATGSLLFKGTVDGRFVSEPIELAIASPLAIADFNGDGQSDIAAAGGFLGNAIRVFLNKTKAGGR